MSFSPRDLVFRSVGGGETLGTVTRYADRLHPQSSFVYAIHLCQDYRGPRYVHGRRGTRSTEARMIVERGWL